MRHYKRGEGQVNCFKQGSALLITLLTMALLLLVVMTFVVMVRLELRKVTEHQNLMMARANARLGAEMAISRLQEMAGSDTRVTAPVQDASARPNQLLIGRVLDAASHIPQGGGLALNPFFRQTLGHFISSVQPASFDPLAFWPFGAAGEVLPGNALLVGPGSVSTTQDANADGVPDGYVAAPLLDLDGKGGFAWWIRDEGLKTQLNITDPVFAATGRRDSRSQKVTAQRTGSEVVLSGYNPDNSTHNAILTRSLNPEQMNLVSGSELGPGVAREFYHDISLQSLGLPTNTRRGGLKRDLTAVLKEAEAAGGGVGGPQWNQLMDFQSARIARWRAETVALETAGQLGAAPGADRHLNALQALTLRADQADSRLNTLIFPPLTDMHPRYDQGGAPWEQLVTWATLKLRRGASSVTAERRWQNTAELSPVIARVNVGAFGTLDYPEASMHFTPTVVLWNPYNVPLRMKSDPDRAWRVVVNFNHNPTLRLQWWMRLRVSNSKWTVPNNSDFSHIPGNSLWTPRFIFHWLGENNDQFVFDLRARNGSTNLVIEPGQARIFTLHDRHVDLTPATPSATFPTAVILKEGLPPASGPGTAGQFSMFLTINLEDQIDDHPHPRHYPHPSTKYSNSGWHTEPSGYNYWHAWEGVYNTLPYPFPLDTAVLANPTDADLIYQKYGHPEPSDKSICVNNGNYLRGGWEFEEMAFVIGRDNTGGNESLDGLTLRLQEGAVPSLNTHWDRVLQEITLPYNKLPGVLARARISDVDHPTRVPVTPTWPVYKTPAATVPFPPSTPGLPAWGITYALRLPENSFYLDSIANEIAGSTASNEVAPTRWLVDFNPSSPFAIRDPSSKDAGFMSTPAYVGGFYMGGDRYNMLDWATPDDLNQFIGNTDDTSPGQVGTQPPAAVLFEVPDSAEDIASVASLMHAPLVPTWHALMSAPNSLPNRSIFSTNREAIPYEMARSGVNYQYMQPVHAIGNSRASLLVTRERAEQSFFPNHFFTTARDSVPYGATVNPRTWPANSLPWFNTYSPPESYLPGYDGSWMYNEVLWDDFFFTPEANSRIAWQQGATPADRDFSTSARQVFIQGAFNVNSISVPAWAALLHSMNNVQVGAQAPPPDTAAFNRFIDPLSPWFDPDDDDVYSPAAYSGYRRLRADDIWNRNNPADPNDDSGLAVEIVRQVRERGPFLSLADFVNRALLPAAADTRGHGLAGALQAAIDDSGLNSAMGTASDAETWIDADTLYNVDLGKNISNAFSSLSRSNASGRRNASSAGELSQADLLARIGSVLQPRSDTFVIRAAGVQGDIDLPGARAWCEITVQRSAEYVDGAADAPGVLPGDLTSPVNVNFGRRFQIVSFRWLNQDEL